METDFSSVSILMTCYKAFGDLATTQQAAQRTLARAEKITTQEPDNGLALGYVVMSSVTSARQNVQGTWRSAPCCSIRTT